MILGPFITQVPIFAFFKIFYFFQSLLLTTFLKDLIRLSADRLFNDFLLKITICFWQMSLED